MWNVVPVVVLGVAMVSAPPARLLTPRSTHVHPLVLHLPTAASHHHITFMARPLVPACCATATACRIISTDVRLLCRTAAAVAAAAICTSPTNPPPQSAVASFFHPHAPQARFPQTPQPPRRPLMTSPNPLDPMSDTPFSCCNHSSNAPPDKCSSQVRALTRKLTNSMRYPCRPPRSP